jgi:hypothetical protein
MAEGMPYERFGNRPRFLISECEARLRARVTPLLAMRCRAVTILAVLDLGLYQWQLLLTINTFVPSASHGPSLSGLRCRCRCGLRGCFVRDHRRVVGPCRLVGRRVLAAAPTPAPTDCHALGIDPKGLSSRFNT